MTSSNPSRASSVKVFSASVIAAASVSGLVAYFNGDTYQSGTQEVTTASGSSVTAGGGRYIATNLADAACRKDINGRYYDCYQSITLTNTGGCVAGGCSTRSYNVASLTKPFAGTGVIRRVDVTCDNQPVNTTTTVGQVTATTASGNGIWIRRSILSGATLVYGTGSQQWLETTPILKLSAGARVGVSQCLFSVTSDEAYNP
jgi:hypothetical protein